LEEFFKKMKNLLGGNRKYETPEGGKRWGRSVKGALLAQSSAIQELHPPRSKSHSLKLEGTSKNEENFHALALVGGESLSKEDQGGQVFFQA